MDTQDTQQRPVAIVTGGSRGIGRAVVCRLAEAGFDVAFAYLNSAAAAEEVEKAASAHGARVVHDKVDVRDLAAVRAFVADAEKRLGPVDALVTSAGIVRDNPMVLLSEDDWRDVRDVNLDGTYHACRAVIFSMMKRRAGSIVTLSSVAGVYGNATQANYAATKAGIIGMTRSLAKEVGRYNVRANVVAPGFIDTDMTAAMLEPARTRLLAQVPLGRIGTPEDVAEMIAFLVSDRARYITGQVFGVDGGVVL